MSHNNKTKCCFVISQNQQNLTNESRTNGNLSIFDLLNKYYFYINPTVENKILDIE